jgi:predicted RecA/RadA family phage recombinase
MKSYVQGGDVVDATAPYDRLSGQGALIGTMFGVATYDVLSGVKGEFAIEGVHDLTRTTGSSTAWTEGAAIYWDDSAKAITKTSSANKLIGVGILPLPGDSDVKGRVRLNGHTS